MKITVLRYVMSCSLEDRDKSGEPDASVLKMNSKPRENSSSPAVSIRAPLLALPLNISISLVYFSMLGSSGWNIAINVSKGTVALLVKTGDECKAQARTALWRANRVGRYSSVSWGDS